MTHFSFRFGHEPEGDRRLERRKTSFKISQRKCKACGTPGNPGQGTPAPPVASCNQQREPRSAVQGARILRTRCGDPAVSATTRGGSRGTGGGCAVT